MEKAEFAQRLTALRIQKGTSARDMSLLIGQSAGYINNIENGVNLPSMTVFFYICEYLGVTPQEFFDVGTKNPCRANELYEICRTLDDKQIGNLIAIAKDLKR